MKEKVLKNVWLRIAMIVAVVTTAFAGTAQAADELYKTALFGGDNNSTKTKGYSTTWYATNSGFTVSVTNFANATKSNSQGVWYGHAKCGTNATITTVAPIDKPISKVTLTLGGTLSSVTSITLSSSADHDDWTPVGTFTAANDWTVDIPTANQGANLYYKIQFTTTNNGDVQVSRVDYYNYYNANATHTPVISATNEPTFESSTTVEITCPTAGAAIQYSLDNGVNWTTYTTPLNLTQTTTVKAKAKASSLQESPIATKTFSLAADVEDVDWNLKVTPTGIHDETNIATWTLDVNNQPTGAVMTLETGTSSRTAYYSIDNLANWLGTPFYQGQTLKIAPIDGYTIVSVTITAQQSGHLENYTNGWQNATATASGNTLTVLPEDGTLPVKVEIMGDAYSTNAATGVAVECAPASSPYITAEEETVKRAAAATGTIEVIYNRILDYLPESSAPTLLLCDETGENAATYSWFTASLDADNNNNVAYSIEQNTGDARTAYMKVSATIVIKGATKTIESPVFALTQESNVAAEQISTTISSVGFSTLYYGTKNLVVPADVTAYTYKLTSENKVAKSHTYETGDVIPAGTAVVLQGEGGSYNFDVTSEGGVEDANNALMGFDVANTTIGVSDTKEYYFYALTLNEQSEANSVGFYWMNDTGAAFTSGANKAYLAVEKSNPYVKGFAFVDDDDATSIRNLNVDDNLNEGAIYNLAGQRLQKMQKGINIVNGKKILF